MSLWIGNFTFRALKTEVKTLLNNNVAYFNNLFNMMLRYVFYIYKIWSFKSYHKFFW